MKNMTVIPPKPQKGNTAAKEEVKRLMAEGLSEEEAKKEAPSIRAAHEMLLKWEQNDPHVRELWSMMNGWVYKGFDETYASLGITFIAAEFLGLFL